MIERVARALCVANGEDPDKPSGAFGVWWKSYRDEARAAIEAMREPTESMVSKGTRAVTLAKNAAHGPEPSAVLKGGTVLAWQIMIDAALSEKP